MPIEYVLSDNPALAIGLGVALVALMATMVWIVDIIFRARDEDEAEERRKKDCGG